MTMGNTFGFTKDPNNCNFGEQVGERPKQLLGDHTEGDEGSE